MQRSDATPHLDNLSSADAGAASRPSGHTSVSEHGVLMVIDQAYGPTGERLVGLSDKTFDGFPALTLRLRGTESGAEGLVHLSPIHGDPRKSGCLDFKAGERCEFFCPVSGRPLDLASEAPDGTRYYAVYLSETLSAASMVYLSERWDHFESRIVDNHELIAVWVDGRVERAAH